MILFISMYIGFKVGRIEDILLEHLEIFYFFDEVYLFGSALDNSKYSNDIDLLLIYRKYTKEIKTEKKVISIYLEKIFNRYIDLTILSKAELEQTCFLEKLGSPYKKIR